VEQAQACWPASPSRLSAVTGFGPAISNEAALLDLSPPPTARKSQSDRIRAASVQMGQAKAVTAANGEGDAGQQASCPQALRNGRQRWWDQPLASNDTGTMASMAGQR